MKGRIDIEQLLVWAYRDECVDRASSGPVGPSTALTASIYNMGALGTRVQNSGAARTSLPEDALVVEAAVNRLDGESARLVVQHARAGTRPDWSIEPPSGVILVGEDGADLPLRRQERRKPAYLWSPRGNEIACRVRFAGTSAPDAREKWLDWMVWHGALGALDAALRPPKTWLRHWELAEFSLPRAPWRDDPAVPPAFISQVFIAKTKED